MAKSKRYAKSRGYKVIRSLVKKIVVFFANLKIYTDPINQLK
jgi:hypothetical protein